MRNYHKRYAFLPGQDDPFEAEEEEYELADWMIAPDGKG